MKKTRLLLLLSLVVSLSFCEKTHTIEIYSGVVVKELNSCTGKGGPPFLIDIDNGDDHSSISTLTLPSKFWIPGKSIKFKLRELKNDDDYIVCNALINVPKQFVVFDVTEN